MLIIEKAKWGTVYSLDYNCYLTLACKISKRKGTKSTLVSHKTSLKHKLHKTSRIASPLAPVCYI